MSDAETPKTISRRGTSRCSTRISKRADLIAKLIDFGRIKNPIGLKMTTEESARLDAALDDAGLIPSDVDAILAENGNRGLVPPPRSQRPALEILRSQINANAIVQARQAADPIETPDRPAIVTVPQCLPARCHRAAFRTAFEDK